MHGVMQPKGYPSWLTQMKIALVSEHQDVIQRFLVQILKELVVDTYGPKVLLLPMQHTKYIYLQERLILVMAFIEATLFQPCVNNYFFSNKNFSALRAAIHPAPAAMTA